MTVVRTLGKNTLGDNNKMKVAMRDYDMSTHDISTIFRSSVDVGMLVPFCKILCQKGDIIDLNLINKTLSQPTLGPLFGSFKLQHFLFFGGLRLYNSWLHNNRTGIGYQDLIQEQMVGETSTYNGSPDISKMTHKAANKTVAWIDYMTNYNRTYGDFATGEALDFMVLNRRYEVNNSEIEDLTTYIDPQKYIEIFADTSIDSQNFWVQTVIQATRRGNYSAKQIPFL
jgi:hypothetical protein